MVVITEQSVSQRELVVHDQNQIVAQIVDYIIIIYCRSTAA